jgi:hypothetical protein
MELSLAPRMIIVILYLFMQVLFHLQWTHTLNDVEFPILPSLGFGMETSWTIKEDVPRTIDHRRSSAGLVVTRT